MSAGHHFMGSSGSHSHQVVDKLLEDPEVRKLLWRAGEINRDEYDLPYLAGYSTDGKTIYIDRHLPDKLSYTYRGVKKEYDVEQFLRDHEAFEKAVIDALGWSYDHAHQAATGYERRHVMRAGLMWQPYQEAYRPYIKADEHEKLKKVPADLDMTPYLQEPIDHRLLARMKKAMYKKAA